MRTSIVLGMILGSFTFEYFWPHEGTFIDHFRAVYWGATSLFGHWALTKMGEIVGRRDRFKEAERQP